MCLGSRGKSCLSILREEREENKILLSKKKGIIFEKNFYKEPQLLKRELCKLLINIRCLLTYYKINNSN